MTLDSFQPLELVVYTAASVSSHPLPTTGQVTIGRGEDNDVRITDPSVSKHHAILRVGPPLYIEDRGSANGIRVQTHRTSAGTSQLVETKLPSGGGMEIGLGDGIKLGMTLVTLRQDEGEAKPVSSRGARSWVQPIVRDLGMRRLYEMVDRVAQGPISVLLLGETGVGKEVMAEAIHRRSPRSKAPFVALNCAALHESLLESELFGHEAGSFTGAVRSKPGLFETAEGGTVFLDEVGELPLTIQVKLLRVLEERKVLRVGGLSRRPINVRFISATNRDLEAESQKGTFRQDLYFRLNGISLVIPPLRQRMAEIEPLAKMFIAKACAQMRLRRPPELAQASLEALLRHGWPGNIRELRNVIERAVVLCSGDVITPEHLGLEKTARHEPPPYGAVREEFPTGPIRDYQSIPFRDSPTTPIPTAPPYPSAPPTFPSAPPYPSAPPTFPSATATFSSGPPPAMSTSSPPPAPPTTAAPLRSEVEELERKRILDALEQCAGNQTKAAELLGMPRRTFVARLSTYGISRPRKKMV